MSPEEVLSQKDASALSKMQNKFTFHPKNANTLQNLLMQSRNSQQPLSQLHRRSSHVYKQLHNKTSLPKSQSIATAVASGKLGIKKSHARQGSVLIKHYGLDSMDASVDTANLKLMLPQKIKRGSQRHLSTHNSLGDCADETVHKLSPREENETAVTSSLEAQQRQQRNAERKHQQVFEGIKSNILSSQLIQRLLHQSTMPSAMHRMQTTEHTMVGTNAILSNTTSTDMQNTDELRSSLPMTPVTPQLYSGAQSNKAGGLISTKSGGGLRGNVMFRTVQTAQGARKKISMCKSQRNATPMQRVGFQLQQQFVEDA